MSAVTETKIRFVDLKPEPGTRTFRLSRLEADADSPAVIIVASGLGGAGQEPFHRPHWWTEGVLRIPVTLLPKLRAALEALEALEAEP